MLPHAEITHNSPGRLRLRIRARRGRADYFAGIEEKLVQCPGVERVLTNPVTGSVLLEPAVDLAALVAFTQAQQLFSWRRHRYSWPPSRNRSPNASAL